MSVLVNMKCILVVLVFVAAASAHLCMLSPPQRGSLMGINTPGAADCMLIEGPCGNRTRGTSVSLVQGKNFTVVFQKNLNHWVKATPGYFSVEFGEENTKNFDQLLMITDMGEPSLTLYSVNVTIPSKGLDKKYILQTRYVTNNPQAPPVFYQCGDVILR